MPKIIARLDSIDNYTKWRKRFDLFEEDRLASGVTTLYVGHELNNKKKIHLIFEVSSIENLLMFVEPSKIRARAISYGHDPLTAEVLSCSD